MSPCLRPEEVIDALDGVLAASRVAHLNGCDACQRTLADVRSALADAAADDVPEPSPFFWPSINARVRSALCDESGPKVASPAPWAAWRRRAWMAPLAGLALLVITLVTSVGRSGMPGAPGGEVALGAPPDAPGMEPDADPALALVADLASVLDDDADPLGLQPLPDLGDVAAATLSAEEQDALRALLRSAVERPPS